MRDSRAKVTTLSLVPMVGLTSPKLSSSQSILTPPLYGPLGRPHVGPRK